MRSFLLDPFLSTVPALDTGEELARGWLEATSSWLLEANSSPYRWRHFLSCTEAVVQSGLFPDFVTLRAIVQRYNIGVDPARLSREFNTFFIDASHDVGDDVLTTDALPDGVVRVTPGVILDRNAEEVRSVLVHSLLRLACDYYRLTDFASGAIFVSLPITTSERMLSVEANVAIMEPEDVHGATFPLAVSAGFPAVFVPTDLRPPLVSAVDIWRGGPDEFLKAVGRLAIAEYDRTPLEAGMGADFWRSMEASGIVNNESALLKLVRVCALVVTDLARSSELDVRQLRMSSAADAEQVVRASDGAKAWRLTIVPRGIGWRLHYWHVPPRHGVQEERIEFANVLRKSDTERII